METFLAALVRVANRRFGPAFEKRCRDPDAIICASPDCRFNDECQIGRPRALYEAEDYPL